MVLPAKDEEKEQACEDVPWEADSKHTGDEEAVPDWEQMMKLVCDSGRFTVLLEVDEDEEEAGGTIEGAFFFPAISAMPPMSSAAAAALPCPARSSRPP